MPAATVTVRELKNKETGIDITIPTTREIPGMIGTTTEYHIVVVTNLRCFKSSKHKDLDVVQFMVPKQLKEFEQYREKLAASFPGTIFPPIPKKMTGFLGSSTVSDRKSQLETFLKFISTTKKVCHQKDTLLFLGVSSVTAQKFLSTDEKGESSPVSSEQDSPKKGLFDDVDEEDANLFSSTTSSVDAGTAADSSLFSTIASPTTEKAADSLVEKETKLFEDQDIGLGVPTAQADKDMFLPEATEKQPKIEIEDNSDLLNIEDDFEKLVKVDTEEVSQRPKSTDEKPTKPQVAPKPGVKKPKPLPKPAAKQSAAKKSASQSQGAAGQDMDSDDIMKYIQENETSKAADLDLFS